MNMRFLISGLGSIGRRHLQNLITLGERDIVFHRSGKSTLPDDELPDFPVESDIDAALERWNPDAVIVSNPTSMHLDVAIPAAIRGCHLLLEKPIANKLDRVDELKNALVSGGGEALVGYQFRFHPGLIKVFELLEDEAIGKPIYVYAHWGEFLPDWHPWEDYRESYSAREDLGGGVLLTLSHPFDYLSWFFGSVQEVSASVKKIEELEISSDSLADVRLTYKEGVLGHVHLNYIQSPPVHQFSIVGTEGLLGWDNRTGAVQIARKGEERMEEYLPTSSFERNDMFLGEMEHFIKIIRGEEKPVCTLADGVESLAIALAAHQSAHERRSIIPKGTIFDG
jgi:predicted dehydrogenase